MLFKSIISLCVCAGLSYGGLHDLYTGEQLSEDQVKLYKENNLVENCTIDFEPCDPNERKRIDGTCNNLKFPARGATNSPQRRVLPANFFNGTYQRKARSGNELTLARKVRTTLLKVGKSSHHDINHNVPGFIVFMFLDGGTTHDVDNILVTEKQCCQEHINDEQCTPNIIPETDPVHRFSGIRCMNSSRPISHQSLNCTKDPTPSPIQIATPAADSSHIYNYKGQGDKNVRSFTNGELIVQQEDGKEFPEGGPSANCLNNLENETFCFKNYFNGLLPTSLFVIWFVRLHNYIARQLAIVNPSWDDETLFQVARDIHIAYGQQLYLYETLVATQGRDNLIKAGVIVEDGGFRDVYDDNKYPMQSVEYSIAIRWFHLLQEGTAKLYDGKGNYIKDYSVFNATFKIGLLALDNNMEYFTQSTFRAPCRNYDHSVDFDTADRAFPNVQVSIDAPAGDLNKNRHFGLPPYVDYVYHFYGRNITCFEDLSFLIEEANIALLKEVYEDVSDIDLLAALWVEKVMEGGIVPPTLANIMNENALWTIQSDRHWYERPNRPYAFTEAQLNEIRKSSLALLFCTVGDNVVEVPRNAFLKISPENPLVDCSEIPKIDFSAWAENTNSNSQYLQKKRNLNQC